MVQGTAEGNIKRALNSKTRDSKFYILLEFLGGDVPPDSLHPDREPDQKILNSIFYAHFRPPVYNNHERGHKHDVHVYIGQEQGVNHVIIIICLEYKAP